jgi:geranylgeranylglycerol-phosphate geranylgeranyltransferase
MLLIKIKAFPTKPNSLLIMNKVIALLRLTRIEHSIMLVIAVLIAEIITRALPVLQILLLSIITPIFISMASFAINDYFDVDSDRLNKRYDRPIISGDISRKGALEVAVASFIIGVAASAFINYAAFIIALVFGALAFLYSYKLKDMLLLGNAYIAFSMAIPFIYGNFVVSGSFNPNILIISAIIFLSGLAREIHGMIRDYKGDRMARRSRNLLSYASKASASLLSLILYSSAIILSIFMFFYLKPFAYNIIYIIPIAVVDMLLLYVSIGYLASSRSGSFYAFSRNISLGAMALALVAYLLAAIIYIPI